MIKDAEIGVIRKDGVKALHKLNEVVNYQAGIFFLLVLAALYLASSFLLPVMAAVFISYALIPFVRVLVKVHIPRVLASLIVVVMFVGIFLGVLIFVSEPAIQLFEKAPRSFERLEELIRKVGKPLEKVNEASAKIDQITTKPESKGEVVVKIKEAGLSEVIMDQTPIFFGGSVSAILLTFFLLAFGDRLLLRVVEISRNLVQKKHAVLAAQNVEKSVSRYLLTITIINIGLGIVVGISLYLLGFEDPILWGALATIFNYIPYLGAVCGVVLLGLASLSVSPSLGEVWIYPAVYMFWTLFEGNFVTPLILGTSFSINPIFIIVALLFLGWLWGLFGALMAVPVLIAIKAYAETSESTRDFAKLIGS